jgi:isoleucyl-tRNA synthetase
LSSGQNKDPKLTIVQKRDNCRNFAAKFVELQKQQFTRLGMFTDFKDIYVTYDNEYEYRQLSLLLSAFKQQLIYRDLKPVY